MLKVALTLTIVLILVCSGLVPTTGRIARAQVKRAAAPHTPISNCIPVHLSQFATSENPGDGDGPLDEAQWWRDAFDVLIEQCKGGELNISGTITDIRSKVLKNFLRLATNIIVTGHGNSRTKIAVGGSENAFEFQDLPKLIWKETTVIGSSINGGGSADAFYAFNFLNTNAYMFDNTFVGLVATTPGSATFKGGAGASLFMDRNDFRACRSHSADDASTVVVDEFVNFRFRDNDVWDYMDLPTGNGTFIHYSTNAQAGYASLKVKNQSAADFAGTVDISYNNVDEGSSFAIIVAPTVRIESVRLDHNIINVGVNGGYWIQNVERLGIEGGATRRHIGPPQLNAITTVSVHFVTIKNFKPHPNTTANKLVVDGGTIMLRVIDSPFATIVNHAQAWRIENGPNVTSFPAAKLWR